MYCVLVALVSCRRECITVLVLSQAVGLGDPTLTSFLFSALLFFLFSTLFSILYSFCFFCFFCFLCSMITILLLF